MTIQPKHQPYQELIQKLIVCETDEQISEVTKAHIFLVDPILLTVLAQSIQDAQQNDKQSLANHLNSLGFWIFELLCRKAMQEYLNVDTQELDSFIQKNADYLLTETAFASAQQLTNQYITQPGILQNISMRLDLLLIQLWQKIEDCNDPADIVHRERLLRKAEALSEGQNPALWADAQWQLGVLYMSESHRDQTAQIEAAIVCYERAMQVYTKESYPIEWAKIQNDLACAFRGRIEGEKAQNLEEAIARYKLALEVFTEAGSHQDRAKIQNNLGSTYIKRIEGEKALNLEEAIACFKQVQQVYTKEGFPKDWANVCYNLGTVYSQRIKGEKADNFEEAIACYKQALEVYTKEDFPQEWARTMLNIGTVYAQRIKRDKAKNQEKAIANFKQALRVFTRANFPQDWARTSINLGGAYRERLKGDKAQNLEDAITYLEQALEVYTKEDFASKWATSHLNLGATYQDRIQGDKAQNLEKAIICYEQALKVYYRESFPWHWALTQNGLGCTYLDRIEGSKAQNQKAAIAFYELALKEWTRDAFPSDWAMAHYNLGNAYREQLQKDNAIHSYKQALQVYTPQAFPLQCHGAARNLGYLLYEQEQWEECRSAFEVTHQANENLRLEVQRQEARKQLAQENFDMYRHLVYVCLMQKDVPAAIRYVSAAKERSLSDRINAGAGNIEKHLEKDPLLAAKWQPIVQLRQALDSLTAQLYQHPSSEESGNTERGITERKAIIHQIEQKRQELKQESDELFFQFPALSATEPAPTLEADDAMQLSTALGSVPLVEYFEHTQGWVAFVVTPQEIQCIDLSSDLYDTTKQVFWWIEAMELSMGDAFNMVEVKELLYNLHKKLIAPLKHLLPDNGPLVIAPAAWMHLMPFQIAYDAATARYLVEDYSLTFTPSLAALRALYQQQKNRANTTSDAGVASQNLLSVVYSATGTASHLPSVLPEAEAIAKHFNPAPASIALHESEATPDQVLQVCRERPFEVVHFGCHGSFDFDQPDNSGLQLAESKLLTVERIRTELSLQQYPLVTLCACQSGRSLAVAGNEAIGLNLSFLSAGAAGVVSSLWSVDDESTKVLFEAFYEERRNKHISEAEALRQAMFKVMGRLRWKHPFYWAAFQVTGLPVIV